MNDITLRLNTPIKNNLVLEKVNRWLVAEAGISSTRTPKTKIRRLQVYIDWCENRGKTPFPASGEQIRDFSRTLFEARDLHYKTVSKYIDVICKAHEMVNLPNPKNDEYHVEVELKRIRSNHNCESKQAKPLVWKDLIKLFKRIDSEEQHEYKRVRDKLILAMAYDTMLRRSELVSIRYSNLHEHDGEKYIKVNGRHIKNKDGLEYDYRPISDYTYNLILEIMSIAPLAEGGFLFRRTNKHGILGAMSDQGVYLTMKKYGYTGHSARVGAAIDQRNAGFSLEEIAQSGGWKSLAMPMHYTRKNDIKRSGSAQFMKIRDSVSE